MLVTLMPAFIFFHYAISFYFVSYLNSIFSPQDLISILLLTEGSSSDGILTLIVIFLMTFENTLLLCSMFKFNKKTGKTLLYDVIVSFSGGLGP